MNSTAIKDSCNVETYNYRSDFQFLSLKEKYRILKNAKYLLKLQKENNILLTDTSISQKENEKRLV